MFSTRSANDVFAAKFTDPLRAVLAGNISDSGPVSETVGRLWSAAEIALEQLPEAEAHKATEGAPLADDVKDAVSATTEALWRAVRAKGVSERPVDLPVPDSPTMAMSMLPSGSQSGRSGSPWTHRDRPEQEPIPWDAHMV